MAILLWGIVLSIIMGIYLWNILLSSEKKCKNSFRHKGGDFFLFMAPVFICGFSLGSDTGLQIYSGKSLRDGDCW